MLICVYLLMADIKDDASAIKIETKAMFLQLKVYNTRIITA